MNMSIPLYSRSSVNNLTKYQPNMKFFLLFLISFISQTTIIAQERDVKAPIVGDGTKSVQCGGVSA